MKIKNFESDSAVKTYVIHEIQETLIQDIKDKDQASLILTGGQTVRPFLTELARLEIPWEKVVVILSDERWVSPDDDRSNEKQMRDLFLNRVKVLPNFVSLKTDHKTPFEACCSLEESIKILSTPITCALLSIGEDGHVASLFPEEESIWMSSTSAFYATNQRGGRVSLNVPIFHRVETIHLLSDHRRVLTQKNKEYLKKIFINDTTICRF